MRAPDIVTGGIEAWLVDDGLAAYGAEVVFPGADPTTPALAAVLDDGGAVPMSHQCLLVRTDGRLVLVDTGYGELAAPDAPTGKLEARLAELGVRPSDIATVVITHAHGDHVGGLLRGTLPAFGEARVLVPRAEWDHWTGPGAEDGTGRTVARFLQPLHDAGLVDIVDGEAEIAAGVTLRPAPGHTPGHAVVDLAGGGDRALYAADALLHDVHVVHPDWVSGFDHDGGPAADTRHRLLAEVAGRNVVVAASHVTTFGLITGGDGSYAWST